MKIYLLKIIQLCLISLILLSLTGGSCRRSLMYNPSLNMPSHVPNQGGDYWLFMGTGLYPEARPEKVGQTHQIGFSDGTTVPLWKGVATNLLLCAGTDNYIVCPGLSFYLPTGNDKMPVIINARYQWAKEYGWFNGEGIGVATQIGTYIYNNDKASLYLMSGFGYASANDYDESVNEGKGGHIDGNGWCILNNLGYSIILSEKASINLESCIIYQYSNYDQIGRLVFSPNISVLFKI